MCIPTLPERFLLLISLVVPVLTSHSDPLSALRRSVVHSHVVPDRIYVCPAPHGASHVLDAAPPVQITTPVEVVPWRTMLVGQIWPADVQLKPGMLSLSHVRVLVEIALLVIALLAILYDWIVLLDRLVLVMVLSAMSEPETSICSM
jgi:hypothetical protein